MKLDKELNPLVEALSEKGIEMATTGSGYIKLFNDNGPVRDASGLPIILPSTPSDNRTYKNTVARLIQAGVLEADPKKVGQKAVATVVKGGGSGSEQFYKARDEYMERRRVENHEASLLAQEALKPVMETLESMPEWRKRGWRVRIGEAYEGWLIRENRPTRIKSQDVGYSFSNSVHAILHGDTVEAWKAVEIAEFADAIKDNPYKLVSDFSQIKAEAAEPTPEPVSQEPDPVPLVEPEQLASLDELEEKVKEWNDEPYRRSSALPSATVDRYKAELAIEALAEMLSSGGFHGEDAKRERAIRVAKRILGC